MDDKYTLSVRVPHSAPEQYRQYAYRELRRKAGNELLDILWKLRLPAVVDVEEVVGKLPGGSWTTNEYDDVLEIRLHITPVQHRDVVDVVYEHLAYGELVKPKNIFDRIHLWFK